MSSPTDSAVAAAYEQAAKAVLSENIGKSLGPFLIGSVIECMLWGFMIHQALIWLSDSGRDRLSLKLFVAWIVCVGSATTFYTVSYVYFLSVLGFGVFINFVALDRLSWFAVLELLTVVAVQLFYTERAYRLNNKNILLPIVIVICLLPIIAGGLGAMIVGQHLSALNTSGVATWFYIWFGGTLGVDLLITGSIMYGLWKSRTGWSQTDRVINKLLRISFESQLPPTIIGLIAVLIYTLDHAGTLALGCLIPHSKVYSCAFFAVLNSRVSIRRDMSSDHNDSSLNKDSNYFNRSSRVHQQTVQLDQIHIDTQKFEESHVSPQLSLGLNREALNLNDAESGYSGRLDYDGTSSLTGLTAVPSRG